MKVQVSTQITIAASSSAIFKYLTDMRYHYLWNPQLQRLSPITTLKTGLEYEAESVVLGVKIKAHNVVTKLVPNKRLEINNNTGMVQYHATFVLTTKGNTTLVVCTTGVSAHSRAFAFAKPVLERLARRELQTDLQALKIAVEQELL